MPPILMDFRIPYGFVYFSDPEYIQDLYVTRNKYFDKGGRMKNQMYKLFGESILLDSSNEWHAQKRKHMSVAFYKDKMVKMLHTITQIAHSRILDWKLKYVEQKQEMVIFREISDLVFDALSATVFGVGNNNRKISIIIDGTKQEVTLAKALRNILAFHIQRLINPFRLFMMPYFDKIYFPSEQHVKTNSDELRLVIKTMVVERKEEMKDPNFVSQEDFLTQMLQDDFFKDVEEFMIDECITIMVAGSQTSTVLIANAVMNLTLNSECKEKMMKEISETNEKKSFQNLNLE